MTSRPDGKVKNISSVCLMWLGLCLPALAADDAEATRATFAALYAKMNTAMNARNTAELGTMLAPGYQGEDVGGKARTAQHLMQEVTSLKDDPNRKMETTFSPVVQEGASARTVRRLRVATFRSPEDKTPSMEYVAVSDDTWTKGEQGWKLAASTVRQADFSLMGRVLVHKTHP